MDAICTVPPGPVRLTREGYNILGGPKDLKIGSPISAVAVTDSRLKSNRDETKRVLRAVLRGLRFMHERKEDTIQIMGHWLSQTIDVARDSYDSILPSFSPDGGTVDKTYEFAIESRKATVRAEKPIPLSGAGFDVVKRGAEGIAVAMNESFDREKVDHGALIFDAGSKPSQARHQRPTSQRK